MRLGISMNPPHSSPEEWEEKILELGLRTVIFPCRYDAPDSLIDRYAEICRAHDISIAEVGAWGNVLSPDPEIRCKAKQKCIRQLELADHVRARCCVNIVGTAGGEQWDGAYKCNFGAEAMKQAADSICEIISAVNPRHTCYTVEPMPWMIPTSPEEYLELIEKVNHPRFAVHMDIVNMLFTPERYFFNAEFMDRAFSVLKGRIRSCHIKDVKIGPKLTLHLDEVMCGDGNVDLKHYADLATAEDPDMPLVIEHLKEWDRYLESYKTLKRILAE